MADSVGTEGSFIEINEKTPVTVEGLRNAFELGAPRVTVAGYNVDFNVTADDFTTVPALKRVIDNIAHVGTGNAITKRARTLLGYRDSYANTRVRNFILFGFDYNSPDVPFGGVGQVRVKMEADLWRAEIFYLIPYTVPPSPLATTKWTQSLDKKLVKISLGNLVVLEIDTAKRKMHIKYFFYLSSKDEVAAARRVATSYGRTLPGMAMQWIKSVAVSTGVHHMDLEDAWKGYGGLGSDDLVFAAHIWQTTEYLKRRAQRTNPDQFNSDSPDYLAAYMNRIKRGGYYGQFGFLNNQTTVPDMIDINGSFADACV